MSDARFAAARHDVSRRRWTRIAIGTLTLILVATLVWVIWFSTLLAVHDVVVEGQTTLSASKIRSTAAIGRRPLARIDTVAAETRVASMDRVQDVSVTRSWPRTIHIEVLERRPIAWVLGGGSVRGLDRFGVEYRSYSKPPRSLIEVRLAETDGPRRQQVLEAVARVVNVIQAKGPALRKDLQSVSASSTDLIVLDLTGGRTVTWGSAADSSRKLTVLSALLRIDATTYDVSAPDQPTTKK